LAYAGIRPEAIAAIAPVDAAAKNLRLLKLFLFMVISLHISRIVICLDPAVSAGL
jgi:hypothetical protein